jgi:hypothetical protein
MDTQLAPAKVPSEIQPAINERDREGLVAGLIGALAVAAFFLAVDVARGRPLQTPSILGTALLDGPSAVARPELIHVSLGIVAFFTLVHFTAFAVVGRIAASLVAIGERYKDASFGAFLLIVMSLYGFEAACSLFASDVVGALGAWEMFAANLLAVIGMTAYFWHRHPDFTVEM